ncbi:MAG TPA: hypothetical protein VNI54_01235 [Thermoanaerobaculia bacterium]|nr:hypothetical protein [Thermoanaerobaculia bacterium]
MLRFVAVMLIALPVFAKSLQWRAVDVQARVESDGSVRIRERLQLVFDGDWNGGERYFSPRPRQTYTLHGITRVEDGREIPLERNGLHQVDHYDFVKSDILRWRARAETDPPFENREITYVLDYSWHNVLQPAGDDGKQFRIDHDFGLPTRAEPIDRYTLLVEFDPLWNMPPVRGEAVNVPPGESFIVDRTLHYSGEAWPGEIERAVPWWIGWAAVLLYAAGATFLVRRFIREERETGRFDPLPAQFDPELLQVKPEVAGAVWDQGIGPAEVAAVLARMTQEGKLTTRADDKRLHMRRNVPYESLEGYERYLIHALFFDGGDETDTDRVKAHYKSRGFNPASVIRPRLEWELSQLPGWAVKVRRARPLLHVLVLPLCALALVIASGFGHADDFGLAAGVLFHGLIFGGIASIVAWRISSRAISDFTAGFVVPGLLMLIPALLFAAGAIQAHRLGFGAPVLFVIPIWLLALLHLVLDLMKIRDSREIVAFRRRIAGARKYFMEQLQKPDPELHDEWFPYVLAFGLAAQADHWFRAFGATSSRSSFSSHSSPTSHSSHSSSSWTGGGGAFGGAGATGSWGLAAAAMAAGVSAPSSSSGGGSSGGGGSSSSGGGGGGGW